MLQPKPCSIVDAKVQFIVRSTSSVTVTKNAPMAVGSTLNARQTSNSTPVLNLTTSKNGIAKIAKCVSRKKRRMMGMMLIKMMTKIWKRLAKHKTLFKTCRKLI